MPEQSEVNNHTSKINVFPVLHTIFFLLAGQKVDLFAPHGEIKSTLWPASRKNNLFHSEFRMLQKAFGDLTMSQKNVYKWYKDFKKGRERVDDLERPGRPST